METRVFMQHFLSAAGERERRVRTVSAQKWATLLAHLPISNAFYMFNDSRFDDGLDGIGTHSSAKTQQWLRGRGLEAAGSGGGSDDTGSYSQDTARSLVSFLLRREPMLERR